MIVIGNIDSLGNRCCARNVGVYKHVVVIEWCGKGKRTASATLGKKSVGTDGGQSAAGGGKIMSEWSNDVGVIYQVTGIARIFSRTGLGTGWGNRLAAQEMAGC